MEFFSNLDVAIEILSRLPAKSIAAFKCTAKRWNDLISDPSFLDLQAKRSRTIMGLFMQKFLIIGKLDFKNVTFIPFNDEESMLQDRVFDFLPEQVVLMSASNGFVCCRSLIYRPSKYMLEFKEEMLSSDPHDGNQKEPVVYICNPTTKEWIEISLDGCHLGVAFGLAFYVGTSSCSSPRFKLVSIKQSKACSNSFLCHIYSSESQKWRVLSESFVCEAKIYPNKVIFVNGRIHWLTTDHHIIVFDVASEFTRVIKLPGLTPAARDQCQVGICLGTSEDHFVYVCVQKSEVKVWFLNDYDQPSWVLKHCLSLLQFIDKHSSTIHLGRVLEYIESSEPEDYFNRHLYPLYFCDDVLYMRTYKKISSYNLGTGKLEIICCLGELDSASFFPTVIPHCESLVRVGSFKDKGFKAEGNSGLPELKQWTRVRASKRSRHMRTVREVISPDKSIAVAAWHDHPKRPRSRDKLHNTVQKVAKEYQFDFDLDSKVIKMVQISAEEHISSILETAAFLAKHAGRSNLEEADIALALKVQKK